MLQKFTLETRNKTCLVDITTEVQKIVGASGVKSGTCIVFVPHTTAAVTLNEHADPDVSTDLLSQLDAIVPQHSRYLHSEGNSPGHIKATLVGNSQTIILENGELFLGTWQGIFFCEFDGPRTRTVYIKITPETA